MRNSIVDNLSDYLHSLRRRTSEETIQDILNVEWIVGQSSCWLLLLLLLLLLWWLLLRHLIVEILLVNLNFEIDNLI